MFSFIEMPGIGGDNIAVEKEKNVIVLFGFWCCNNIHRLQRVLIDNHDVCICASTSVHAYTKSA